MPFMVETVPGGFAAGADMRTPERVAAWPERAGWRGSGQGTERP